MGWAGWGAGEIPPRGSLFHPLSPGPRAGRIGAHPGLNGPAFHPPTPVRTHPMSPPTRRPVPPAGPWASFPRQPGTAPSP
jgi:hypothetical protein